VTIVGCYMPAPFQGFQAMRAGLSHDTFLEAYRISKDKQNFRETFLTEDALNKIFELKARMGTE
jgi:DNA replication licensing factor MCM7